MPYRAVYTKRTNSINTLSFACEAFLMFEKVDVLGKENGMIIIDYSDKRPIYEQVVDKIQMLIVNGALEADAKLPSVRALAVELAINPNTIQRAYAELERRGFIYSVKGRGNFVRADEHLKEKQQEKFLHVLEKQLISCREQGITRKKIRTCVDKVYGTKEEAEV